MTAIPESLSRTLSRIFLLGFLVVGMGCEKPKLRSDTAEESKDSISLTDPLPPSPPSEFPPTRSAGETTSAAKPVASLSSPPLRESPASRPPTSSDLDPAARAREYTRIQKRLEAQMVGIRGLESDLARHSATLIQLRNKLQLTRSLQAGARRGGIRVERVNGESTLIDRNADARVLEREIGAVEPLVAQLSTSLQEAQRQYEELLRHAENLLVE